MFKSIAVLALAGSAIAHPAIEARRLKTVVHTVVVTKTELVTYTGVPQPSSKAPEYTPAPEPSKAAPSSKKEEYVVVTPTPTPKPSSKAPEYTPAPKPSSSAVYTPPANPSKPSYYAVIDEYRTKLGLKLLNWDAKLEANALDTVKSSNGQMVHKLNPGSFAQVLAPGGPNDFKKVFLGGWLCERPDLPGISAECAAASQGWIHDSTGHADIIVSDAYSKCACAIFNGIWSCDFA